VCGFDAYCCTTAWDKLCVASCQECGGCGLPAACEGHCGQLSPAGCSCTKDCAATGTCCADACTTCGACGG
jgi:hypothetical protein